MAIPQSPTIVKKFNILGGFGLLLNYNDKHEPAGGPKGGQFAPRGIGGFRQLDIAGQARVLDNIWKKNGEGMPDYLPKDNLFQQFSYFIGNNAKPDVLPKDRFIAIGGKVLYRFVNKNVKAGMSSEEVANDFKYGEITYQGEGDYCGGTHFGDTLEYVREHYDDGDGTLIEAKLKSDAKIYDSIGMQPEAIRTRVETFTKLAKKRGLSLPFSEAEAIALLGAGYDVFRYQYNETNKHTVVLRRDVLYVKQ